MQTAEYITQIALADDPDVNLITNPNAAVSLSNATATNAGLVRQSPFGAPNAPVAGRRVRPQEPTLTRLLIAGMASPAEFFSEENAGRILAAVR